MVQLNFDAKAHSPLDNDPIPEGWYNFIIDESGAAPTKDGNPNHLRLNLRASVMDGPHQGRKVFIGLNIRHTNIQTMEIANRELSSIAAAVGMPYIQDTQQIHNIPFKGRVKIRKDPNGQYDDQAEIKSYKHISFVVPGVLNQPGAVAAPQAAPQQVAPQGWAPQPAPQQYAPNGQAPQQMPQQPPNGGWQQPPQAQPWGQPQQAAPQVAPQATPLPPVQFAPEPQPAPQPQAAPQGFAAPTPPPQPQLAPQAAPPSPEVAAAQQASPPWARQG